MSELKRKSCVGRQLDYLDYLFGVGTKELPYHSRGGAAGLAAVIWALVELFGLRLEGLSFLGPFPPPLVLPAA